MGSCVNPESHKAQVRTARLGRNEESACWGLRGITRIQISLGFLGILLAPVGVATGALAPASQVEFSNENGWDASGTLEFSCPLQGLRFTDHAPIVFDVSSFGGTLTIYETWLNRTGIRGPAEFVYDLTGEQHARTVDVPPGAFRVTWSAEDRAVAFDWGGFVEGGDLRATWTAPNVSLGPPVSRVDSGLVHPSVYRGQVGFVHRDLPGPARRIENPDQPLRVHGDLGLTVTGATIRGESGFHLALPPYRQERARAGTEEANLRTVLLTHASLHVNPATVRVRPLDADLVCRDVDATVHGVATFHEARGQYPGPRGPEAFDRRELTLNGNFTVRDRLDGGSPGPDSGFGPAGVRAPDVTAEGSFTAIGLDFVRVESGNTGNWDEAAKIGLLSLVLAALGWMTLEASRLVGFCYTRLAPERVLDHPLRQAMMAYVSARPGLILREFVDRFGRPYAVIRHHARVLQGAGRVQVLRHGKSLRVYPPGTSLPQARQELALATDAPVRFVVESVGAAQRSARELSLDLRRGFGLSRMGAWKVLRRAVAHGLVRSVAAGGEVRLCAPVE